jgi:zinc transporter ZupT
MNLSALFALPIIAVLIGVLIAVLVERRSKSPLWILLPFSGSFLLSITLFDLMPELFSAPETKGISLAVLCGILLQIFLEFFSKGAEHGHVHVSDSGENRPYYLSVFTALFIHAFLEGAPLAHIETLSIAVFLHKIPIAMVVYQFLKKANFSAARSYVLLVSFAIMTPLGLFLGQLIADSSLRIYLDALSAGIFLHVSTVILFESEKGHRFNAKKITAIIAAIVLAYLI